MEWGSFAELLSGVGTIAALVVAAIAARAAIRTNDQQGVQLLRLEEAEAERRNEAEREDAARVAFWSGVNSEGPGIWYVNQSGMPIHKLQLHVSVPGKTFIVTRDSVGPTSEPRVLKSVRRELMDYSRQVQHVDWMEHLEGGDFTCACTFRDTADRWWSRSTTGLLTRHPDQRAAIRAIRAPDPGADG